MIDFFVRRDIQDNLQALQVKLRGQHPKELEEKAKQLSQLLDIVQNNSEKFDSSCQVNIEWVGASLDAELSNLIKPAIGPEEVDSLYGTFFRFVVEFDLSMQTDISRQLKRFLSFADENLDRFSERSRSDMTFARQQMPIAILKKLLGSDVLQNVANLKSINEKIDASTKSWQEELSSREAAANVLKSSLEKYEKGFNFVGLHQGFDELSGEKKVELGQLSVILFLLGIAVIAPVIGELLIFVFNRDRFDEVKAFLAFTALPTFSISFLLLYYFRIILRRVEGVKAQLLQIELRKTLCRFIQSYADYSKTIKDKNSDLLSKFENVIFSSIVSSDEKIPTSFDGLDQISNLVKALKSKP